MRIHHVTIPAHDSQRVANALAEIFGGRVIPMPHPHGSLLVYSGDSDGTAIEVWPAGMRGRIGARELEVRDEPLPADWPHHAYLTSDVSEPERVLAIFAREGWRAEKVHNGPPHSGFGLVRGWIENHCCIEIGGRAMREQYERFFAEAVQGGKS